MDFFLFFMFYYIDYFLFESKQQNIPLTTSKFDERFVSLLGLVQECCFEQ